MKKILPTVFLILAGLGAPPSFAQPPAQLVATAPEPAAPGGDFSFHNLTQGYIKLLNNPWGLTRFAEHMNAAFAANHAVLAKSWSGTTPATVILTTGLTVLMTTLQFLSYGIFTAIAGLLFLNITLIKIILGGALLGWPLLLVKKVRQTLPTKNFHWRRAAHTMLFYGLTVAVLLVPAAAYEIYLTGTLPEILALPGANSLVAAPEAHGLVVQSLLLTAALFGSLVFLAYLLLMTPAAVIQRSRASFFRNFIGTKP